LEFSAGEIGFSAAAAAVAPLSDWENKKKKESENWIEWKRYELRKRDKPFGA
jgi:hypothetical protein